MTSLVVPYPGPTIAPLRLPAPSRLLVAVLAAVAVLATALVVAPDATTPTQLAVAQVQWIDGQTVGVTTPDVAGVEFTVVQHTGGVQALFEIEGPDAPTAYRFDNAIPAGHTATISASGSVTITDTAGATTGVIAAPWALDANGVDVPTHYTIDGTTLTQTVDHLGTGIVYPITADPCWETSNPHTTCQNSGYRYVPPPPPSPPLQWWESALIGASSGFLGAVTCLPAGPVAAALCGAVVGAVTAAAAG